MRRQIPVAAFSRLPGSDRPALR